MDGGNRSHHGCSGGHEDLVLHGFSKISGASKALLSLAVKYPKLLMGNDKKGPRDVHQRLTFPTSTRNDRDNRMRMQRIYRAPLSPREQGNKAVPVLSLDSLIKCPKEILATETQLQLPAPRPVANPLRTGDPDKKLNHLNEGPKAKGRKGPRPNPPPPPKVINMVGILSSKEKKRKDREATEAWMNTPITFPGVISDDASDEPLIIEAEVEGYLVRRVYVDEGSSVEVMFEHCFENLPAKVRAGLRETRTDLVGFAGEVAKPLGKIDLEVCFGNEGLSRRMSIKFLVIRAPSPYNIILGRPGLKALHAIPSTIHSMVRFPTPKGIATLVTRSTIIAECRLREEKQILTEKQPEVHETGQPDEGADLTEQILVNPYFPDQIITIGGRLSPDCKNQLKTLLINNMEVFAWEPSDMTGVPRKIIEHSLNVNPSLDPFCQKRRTFSPEKSEAVTNEMQEEDEEKTAFYPRTRTTLHEDPFDDMAAKSKDEKDLLADIAETFENLKAINMKLNPKKMTPRGKKLFQQMKRLANNIPFPSINKPPLSEGDTVCIPSSGKRGCLSSTADRSKRKTMPSPVCEQEHLNDAEKNYSPLEKLALSLVNMTRRLRSTNNEAEYEALLAGLRIARKMKVSAKEFISEFKTFSIENIPREDNQKADILSKLATVPFSHLTKEILVEILNERSTDAKEVQTVVEEEWENWMTPIIKYLKEGIVPSDKNEARSLRAKISQYVIESGILFKKGYLVPMLRGLDILGAIDTTRGGASLLWFGLPRIIVIDNGAQLVNEPFKGWCTRFKIQQMNTSVAHPQANGLVEGQKNHSGRDQVRSRRAGRGGKDRLVDEFLPKCSYRAHRTSIKQSNGETSFSLTYGSETVIPAEIGIPSYRTLMIREEYNEEEQRLNLDLLQERREAAAIREAKNAASRDGRMMEVGPNWEGHLRVTEAFEKALYTVQTMEDKVFLEPLHAVITQMLL
ncbi:reverse transcriptase domain-containing protein [Tanacetum coccineum]